VGAEQVAVVYRKLGTIEVAFGELTVNWKYAVNKLAYLIHEPMEAVPFSNSTVSIAGTFASALLQASSTAVDRAERSNLWKRVFRPV
jgi:hypothetical protein